MVIWKLTGPSGTRLFGTGVDGAGDVDGDGHDDLIVGGHSGTSSASVFSGKTGKALWTAQVSGSLYGFQVCGCGDMDLDGIPEVAVSQSSANKVYIYNGKTGALKATITGSTGGNLGYSLNGGGDVNKDGFPDFAAGSSRSTGNSSSSGQIWVISGKWLRLKTGPQILFKFSGRARSSMTSREIRLRP